VARLERFVVAQAGSYEGAVAELRAGRKVGHWIWWVLPQLRGLGSSANSTFYGIASLEEARSYARHPVLGPRLREAVGALLDHEERGAEAVLGADAVKARSSLTLFARAVPEDPLFAGALKRLFDGREDELTLALLGEAAGAPSG
jgi:uncharacterized protein (DUF1810 family)